MSEDEKIARRVRNFQMPSRDLLIQSFFVGNDAKSFEEQLQAVILFALKHNSLIIPKGD